VPSPHDLDQGRDRPRPSTERLRPAASEAVLVLSAFLSLLLGSLIARVRSERGQTMAEYGILIAVIALVVVVVAVTLGGAISSLFGTTASSV
jgi:Flp pilus assembly pilin Flp